MSGNGDTYKTTRGGCVSPYQDAKFGPGMRVHNVQGGKNKEFSRCTVCGSGYGPVRP